MFPAATALTEREQGPLGGDKRGRNSVEIQ